jgi:hypothetical protein
MGSAVRAELFEQHEAGRIHAFLIKLMANSRTTALTTAVINEPIILLTLMIYDFSLYRFQTRSSAMSR